MLATEILTQQHHDALDLIDELGAASDGETASYDTIFRRLEDALLLHMREEEEIYYPALAKREEFSDLLSYSIPEHEAVRQFLAQLEPMSPSDDAFQDTLADMRAAIEDHADNEEEDVFPKSIEVLGEDRINELGKEIENMKNAVNKRKTATP